MSVELICFWEKMRRFLVRSMSTNALRSVSCSSAYTTITAEFEFPTGTAPGRKRITNYSTYKTTFSRFGSKGRSIPTSICDQVATADLYALIVKEFLANICKEL